MHMRKLETACEMAIEARMQERTALACVEESIEAPEPLSEHDRGWIHMLLTETARSIVSDPVALQGSMNSVNLRSMSKALGPPMAKAIAMQLGSPMEGASE